MKKILLLGLSVIMCGIAKADLFDLQKSKEYSLWFSSTSPTGFSGTTTYILIDLTDTTNWPHKDTGELHINSIEINLDKAAASTTTVRLGVVNFVNASTGSVTWFSGIKSINNVSNTNSTFQFLFPDLGINTKVRPASTPDTDGSTPYIISTETTSGSTAFQDDTAMPTIRSTTIIPKVGDIVMEIGKSGTAIVYDLLVKYHSMP